jgi:hypothetical protein
MHTNQRAIYTHSIFRFSPRGVALAAILFSTPVLSSSASCPCSYTDTVSSINSADEAENYLDSLEKCHEYREGLGVYQNYCNSTILQKASSMDLSHVSPQLLDLIEYLNGKCMEYNDELDYPIDLCGEKINPYAGADSSRGSLAINPLLKSKLCAEMMDDIDEELPLFKKKWSSPRIGSYALPHYELRPPSSGKMFFKVAGGLAGVSVCGLIASVLILNNPAGPAESLADDANSEGGAWLGAGIGLLAVIVVPVATIASGVGSITLLAIGSMKETKVAHHPVEAEKVKKTPRLGLEIHLEFE